MIVPDDLTPNGRGEAFWEAVTEAYDAFTPAEHELAVEAARLLDLIEELRTVVAAEGAVVRDGRGTRTHPALVELRHAREQVRKTLAALNLPDDEGETASERRARRAANARHTRKSRRLV